MIAFILLLSCNNDQTGRKPVRSTDLAIYKNQTAKIAMEYPMQWDTSRLERRMLLTATDTNARSDFRTMMSLYALPVPNEMTLESILQSSVIEFKKAYPDVAILISEIRMNGNGVHYSFVKSQFKQNNVDLITRVVYLLRHDDLFILTFGNDEKLDVQLDTFYERIIYSFRFL